MTIVPRHLLGEIRRALADTPVVVVTGPRQAGKSTLVQQLAGRTARYVTLDDGATRSAAVADPEAFLTDLGTPAIIDEAQRAPGLPLAIKALVDRRRSPGSFVLTGSADLWTLPGFATALAGRMEIFTLWPLSQGELEGHRERFVDAVFAHRLPSLGTGDELRRAVFDRALRGGYPEVALRRRTARRGAWFRSYVASVVDREVRDLSRIEDLDELPRLLALLAARATDVLNMSEVGRALEMNKMTLFRYLALLERVFLIQRVRAWAGDIGRRVIQHPKLLLTDTGLLAHLQELDLDRALRDGRLGGALLENFVLEEIAKQVGWSRVKPSLHYLRTYDGAEIDAVLERRNGDVVGIEVKSGHALNEGDFAALRSFASRVGERFRRGILLYTGREPVAFGRRLNAVPLHALWTF
ncbi:MAG: ATP-binding protein [Chloroflexi bacterium]|nr:ATP-binding protein [Chloroflexota bacterium]